MTDDAKNEIAALRAELDRLKPTEIDDAAMRQWQSDMHNLREARMSHASHFSRADLEAMEAAAPTHVVRAIVGRDSHAPTGPSSAGTSGQLGRISANPGIPGSNTSGWLKESPISPPPGIHHIDRMMAHEDIEFRRQRIAEAQALKAVTEEKK